MLGDVSSPWGFNFRLCMCFKFSMIKSEVKENWGCGDQGKFQGYGTREGSLLRGCVLTLDPEAGLAECFQV